MRRMPLKNQLKSDGWGFLTKEMKNIRSYLFLLTSILGYFTLEVLYASVEQVGLPLPLWYAGLSLVIVTLLSLAVWYIWRIVRDYTIVSRVNGILILSSLVLVSKIYIVGGLRSYLPYVIFLLPFSVLFLMVNFWPKLVRESLLWPLVPLTLVVMGTRVIKRYWDRWVIENPLYWRSAEFVQISFLGCLFGIALILIVRYSERLEKFFLGNISILGVLACFFILSSGSFWGAYQEKIWWEYNSKVPEKIPDVTKSSSQFSVQKSPPVILVSIDTMRWDSLFGDDRRKRYLQDFREDSFQFTKVISTTSWTLPSHASLLTGLLPFEHGAVKQIGSAIDSAIPTAPQFFRRAGYRTAAFTDGGYVRRELGFGRGFDTYWEQNETAYKDFVPGVVEVVSLILRGTNYHFPVGISGTTRNEKAHRTYFSENLKLARRWIRDRRNPAPFLLFLHTYQVHDYWTLYDDSFSRLRAESPAIAENIKKSDGQGLLNSNPEYVSDSMLEGYEFLYRQEEKEVLNKLEQFLSFLKSEDLYDKSFILLISDHGEGFTLEPDPVIGHNDEQLDTVLTRVPVILKPPGNGGDRRKIRKLVQITDLFPPVFDGLGLESNYKPLFKKKFGWNELIGDSQWRHYTRGSHVLMAEEKLNDNSAKFFVRDRKYKLIKNLRSGRSHYRVDTMEDNEKTSEAEVPEKRKKELNREMQNYIKDYRQSRDVYNQTNQTTRQSTRKKLKGLGYL